MTGSTEVTETTGEAAVESARRKFHRDTSWEEIPAAEVSGAYADVVAQRFTVGADPSDLSRPVVVRTTFPPGFEVEPHTHPCDYAEIVLEGSQQVTRRWYGPGDIRVVQAGTVYGPLIAGPEGCTVLLIFSSGDREMIRPQDLSTERSS